jgi:HD-GYP domain-containing protein (c-di-GMP phosphodiesterase class II)
VPVSARIDIAPTNGVIHRPRRDVWDVLDRFGQELQTCQDAAVQVHLLARAARDCVGADVAVYVDRAGGNTAVSGGSPFSGETYEALLPRIADTDPDTSRLVSPGWQTGPDGAVGRPFHAGLIRVQRSPDTWIAVISLNPQRCFTEDDLKPLRVVRRFFLNQQKHCRTHHKLKDTLFGLIHCLTEAIEAKDPNTCGHSERVGRIAARIGKEMGLDATTISDLYLAGLLHDVGKIGVRDSVLLKAGRLTPEEEQHIQQHSVIGDRIVATIKQLEHLRPGVRNHHERWDGKGYPDGLAGEAIPKLARILAVADSCDAMMADRVYRPALPTDLIESIFQKGAGVQWDPAIVRPFMACRSELYPICQRGLGESVARAIEQRVNSPASLAGSLPPLIFGNEQKILGG